ncbi:hypothetical protein K438DRAFT_2015284 [Mycena galopus ATCC 62051]|nr:hypothetical protein K438DRAFT_2015284 [Mycena galopus ATCC 62051]
MAPLTTHSHAQGTMSLSTRRYPSAPIAQCLCSTYLQISIDLEHPAGTSTLNAQPEDDPSQAYAPTQLTFHVPLPPKLEDPPRSGATLAPAAAP